MSDESRTTERSSAIADKPAIGDASGGTVCAATERDHVPPEERRHSTRYRLRDARATLSWDGGSEPISCDGDILNISGGGAALLIERAAQPGQSVELKLGRNLAAMAPLDARALACTADASGKFLVRLQFTHWVVLDAILEHHLERRLWERFPVRETHAKLTWLVEGSEKTVRGELLNISGGGAAVIVDELAPASEPIWFELETDGRVLDPVESRLVVTSIDPSGSRIARISFVDACPIDLFEIATRGSA